MGASPPQREDSLFPFLEELDLGFFSLVTFSVPFPVDTLVSGFIVN